ncbi:cupredoxin domain-containing protein [Aeromonas diversa]|uniref:cupredoxin domain-containing protein n=1 Tax=Aeromonas diversa TaxID=502790 RepID=UPI003462BAD6
MRVMTALLLAATFTVQADGSHLLGVPAHQRPVDRTLTVTLNDTMRFSPAALRVAAGETVRLRLHNQGKLPHEFVLGEMDNLRQHAEMMRQHPEMEHDDPGMVSLAPGASSDLVWYFPKAGQIDFACLLPGHMEAGMVGQIRVEEGDIEGLSVAGSM